MMLTCYLVWLPVYDKAAMTKLLHPDDPQDIPHAVALMQAIIEFSTSQRHVTNNLFSLDIDTHVNLASISLLGAPFESILLPFIKVLLMLSEQFQYLGHYAHLAFSFFHAHHCSFMSYQLYYDTQMLVKNTAFCLVKQQTLDPYAHFSWRCWR
jgi:hypothetical protein